MQNDRVLRYLKEMLREQLYCLGRVFARHEVADDVIWEVVKGFDLIHQRIKEEIGDASESETSNSDLHKMKPHPGLTYLLEKIEK